jgi:hypothetical protein
MVKLLRYVQTRPDRPVFLRTLPVKGFYGIPPADADRDRATGHVFAENGPGGALDEKEQIEVQALARAGYAIAGQRRVAFNVIANHTPTYGPDGQYGEDPRCLRPHSRASRTTWDHSLLYTSQLGD